MGSESLIFDRAELLKFFQLLDQELKSTARLYVIGGAAATVVYETKTGTKDVDTWQAEKNVEEAYKRVLEKHPKFSLPLGPARVQIKSDRMLKRFSPARKIQFKKLELYFPDPEDLFLLKAQRADEKDIDDLKSLAQKVSLNGDEILNRFLNDLLPLNGGSDDLLVENYLVTVADVLGVSVATTHQDTIRSRSTND